MLDLSQLGAATLYRILGASKIWANLNAVSKSKAPVLGPSKVIARCVTPADDVSTAAGPRNGRSETKLEACEARAGYPFPILWPIDVVIEFHHRRC